MKVAVAFAGLMASSVMADGLTRLHFYSGGDADCRNTTSETDAQSNDTYPGSSGAYSYWWTKVNIDAFVFSDDHIKVHAFHYFPFTAGDNMINPSADDAYSTDDYLTKTDTQFVTDLGVAVGNSENLGREMFFRIDYETDKEDSCTFEKLENGSFSFDLKTVWNICATHTCEAALTTTGTPQQSDFNIFTRQGDTTQNFPNDFDVTYTTLNGKSVSNFGFGLDAYADDAETERPCLKYSNSLTAANIDREDASFGSITNSLMRYGNTYSNGSMKNANVKPTADADSVDADPSDFKFQSVLNKMCGDSTRVAQVAALSVASVAAGLFSFL
jgi:hypothetical protein